MSAFSAWTIMVIPAFFASIMALRMDSSSE